MQYVLRAVEDGGGRIQRRIKGINRPTGNDGDGIRHPSLEAWK
jgi:hypothetical protein